MTETNNLHDLGMSDWLPAGARQVDWTDPLLARIVRLRFLSENNRNGYILACARRDGVYAKELGVFDAISTLT